MLITLLISLFVSGNEYTLKDTIPEASIFSSAKQSVPFGQMAGQTTSIYIKDIEKQGIKNPKFLSSIIPNLNIPDYGSSMTSSIYMRGFGSRIDNPVIGLYIDDIPIMDKNAYDFNFLDIRRIDLLRGPQGAIYGRNSMTGLLSIKTLTPDDIQGTRIGIEGGTKDMDVSFSTYAKKRNFNTGLSLAAQYGRGYYYNTYNNKPIGRHGGFSGRYYLSKRLRDKILFENILSFSYSKETGYPYRQINPDNSSEIYPVSYNDYCGYRRLTILDGVKLHFKKGNFYFSSISSIQLLFDKMDLDNDFTAKSIFSLIQRQRQGTVTQDFIIKPISHPKWWNYQTGVFSFIKYNNMNAPVQFKHDGIKSLILDNANKHIPDWLGKLAFKESEFPIISNFGITTYNAAIYHESYFSVGKWLFTAGLRLDHEGNFMVYDSRSTLNFRIIPAMEDYKEFNIKYTGSTNNFYWQILPKISALYDFGKCKLYALFSKGYRSGGFNTQIFSDILQNQMMTGMMNELGIHLSENKGITANNTTYKPEMSFNYEVGLKYDNISKGGHQIHFSGDVFYIDCRNQQITVFPPGKRIGRMMANAGHSFSTGIELETRYKYKGINLAGSLGYTLAKFLQYNDGNTDYSGNRIPYNPECTSFLRAGYEFTFNNSFIEKLSIATDFTGIGKIWWNENNSITGRPYSLMGADIELLFNKFSIYSRMENILSEKYHTFYFKSIGNSFFQDGKPFRFVIGLRFKL